MVSGKCMSHLPIGMKQMFFQFFLCLIIANNTTLSIKRLNDKNLRKIVSEQYLNSAKLNLSPEKQSLMDYLNQFTIYLQEFRTEAVNGHAGYANKKVIRILLNKKIWVQKYAENSKICMKFAQFNDEMELRSYQRQYFTINPKQITDIFTERTQVFLCLNKIVIYQGCIIISCTR